MSDLPGVLDPAGYGLLSRTLTRCEGDAVTGRVRVTGSPGGVFHLRRGQVVAVESPGAPGPEALLLRSGRLSEADWADVLAAGASARWPGPELIARGCIGAAELRVICVMAARDAVFAMVAGEVTECATAPESGELVPVGRGEEPTRLLQEAARKLAGLAQLPHFVLPDRHRLVPGSATDVPADRLSAVRREILYLADGRRTPRDIAFMAGRGVYTVTVETSRMLGEGLLARVGRAATVAATGAQPRTYPALRPRKPGGREGTETGSSGHLPRRSPGASGRTGALAAGDPAASWRGLFRWAGRIRSADSGCPVPKEPADSSTYDDGTAPRTSTTHKHHAQARGTTE
ncbi:MarR family transcriptional regulator [Streptomyces sp. E11-3]|uniref:MarR family transcriptional regulator n=1 Tax=Streptomyces sp. E11-3 TaxID=3110112 RepID=UPI00398022F9